MVHIYTSLVTEWNVLHHILNYEIPFIHILRNSM